MSGASFPDPYSTGHYRPEYDAAESVAPTESLLTVISKAEQDVSETNEPHPQNEYEEESKLVGLYAVVLFSGILFLSGLGVMLSEDIPRWLNQPHFNEATNIQSYRSEASKVSLTDIADTLKSSIHQSAKTVEIANTSQNPANMNAYAIPYPKLPTRFEPVWTQHTLEKSKRPITLLTLKKPFKLSNTTQKSGLEYFTYNAYLLRQLASQIPDANIQQNLLRLSQLSNSMASQLQNAIESDFNGIPMTDLQHLHEKELAMQALQSLTSDPLEIINADRNGLPLRFENNKSKHAFNAGYDLKEYQATLKQIILNPAMRRDYPDTTALLISQGNRLQNISKHLTLRWESNFSCLKAACEAKPANARIYSMHIYVKQNLQDNV